MRGMGCKISFDYPTAIYNAIWDSCVYGIIVIWRSRVNVLGMVA